MNFGKVVVEKRKTYAMETMAISLRRRKVGKMKDKK